MSDRPLEDSPLVVSYGGGVDSTAILVGLKRLGVRPDLIVFADTGSEKPETYEALRVVGRWVGSVWPGLEVTTVRHRTRTQYSTLEGNCLANETLPSLAFGHHSCSLKWKVDPIDAFLRSWTPALEAVRAGRQIVRVIGYDAGRADSRRWAKAAAKESEGWSPWSYWYPLRDWGWTREQCEAAISEEEGLARELFEQLGQRTPPKSACFFCPASKKAEVEDLARRHPLLALRAVTMERRALEGKHGLESRFLGISWSWEGHLKTLGLLEEDWMPRAVSEGFMPADWAEYSREALAARERLASLHKSAREKLEAASLDEAAALEWEASEGASKWLHDKAEFLAAWLEIKHEISAAEARRKVMKAPDWRDAPKNNVPLEERRSAREANKAWKLALENLDSMVV